MTSRHAVVGLTKSAALDYATKGIRVNAVCPGHVWTPMTMGMRDRPERMERLLRMYPAGRFGQPPKIAEFVVWLRSAGASFVNGTAIPVDGAFWHSSAFRHMVASDRPASDRQAVFKEDTAKSPS